MAWTKLSRQFVITWQTITNESLGEVMMTEVVPNSSTSTPQVQLSRIDGLRSGSPVTAIGALGQRLTVWHGADWRAPFAGNNMNVFGQLQETGEFRDLEIHTEGNDARITWFATVGLPHCLEASPDLVNWDNIHETIGAGAVHTYRETDAVIDHDRRFYRLVICRR